MEAFLDRPPDIGLPPGSAVMSAPSAQRTVRPMVSFRRWFPVSAATQEELMNTFSLTPDNVASILANVTMAIQPKKGPVWNPAVGGWYTTTGNPRTYIACPGFRTAWQGKHLQTRPAR